MQRCCRVYYRHFELWLFHGRIEDDSGELFVQYTDVQWPYSKHFWDNAFRVRDDGTVPAFLRGTEQATLLCGKYTRLLKEIRPEHPLLRIEPLQLQVCLSDSALAEMQTVCRTYGERTQRICGAPIRIRTVYAARRAQRVECVRQATERFAENMTRWRAEQAVRAAVVRAEHERRRCVLEAQIEEQRNRRVLLRAQSLREDREMLRQAEQLEEEHVRRERADRERRIGYYEELGQLVERRRTEADEVVRDLRVQLTDAKTLTAQMTSCLVAGQAEPEGELSHAEDVIETDGNRNELKPNAPETVDVCSNDDLESCSTVRTTEPDANANPSTHKFTDDVALNNNKAMVLGTTFDFQHHSSATAQKATEMLRVTDVDSKNANTSSDIIDANSNTCCDMLPTKTSSSNTINSTAHQEMLHNRARVMGQEYDLIGHTTTEPPSAAAQLLSVADAELQMTDLQRNRRRVMTEEYTTAVDKRNVQAASASLTLPLKTGPTQSGCQRKVPTGLPFLLESTPMSTSSDTPSKRFEDGIVAGEAESVFVSAEDEITCDLPLKLDVSRAMELQQKNVSAVVSSSAVSGDSSSAMQTALPRLDIELLQGSSGSSVYETACSANHADDCIGFDFNVTVQPEVNTATAPNKSHKFEYAKSMAAAPSEYNQFWQLASSPDNRKTPTQTMYNSTGLASAETEADISTLTGRLRASYLLPLHTHLAILSNEILKVFVLDLQTLDHFKSLRNYFFMMDGEFAGHICDGLFVKLEQQRLRPSEMLNFACLHALLDGALGSSIIGNDPNAERLSFRVDATDDDAFVLRSPHVLHMLTLTYEVEWPLNLLLSPAAISHYGRIFQHLMMLRRCRYVLDDVSQLLKAVAKRANGGRARCVRSPQFGRVQQLRNKLLQFVNALQNHVTASALQASWRQFKLELEDAQSLEDCYQMHKRYLKRVEFLCMLNRSSAKFYGALENVMTLTLRFYQ